MAHALCHPVWEKICSLDIKKKGGVGVFWTNYMQEHLRAETQINSGLNQPAFTTSINPWGSLWYAPLAAIYYINMLKFYMHVYYLPESLFCSSNLDLYHRLTNKKKKKWGWRGDHDVQCYPLTSRWKCMHIKWLSECQEVLLQCHLPLVDNALPRNPVCTSLSW